MAMSGIDLTPDKIKERLKKAGETASNQKVFQSRIPGEYFHEPPRKAAVLIPLFLETGEWRVLYTRRNDALPEHSGQVAFPGGRSDEEDESPVKTALREAQEELNILPQDVSILGQLPSLRTISNYCVTPVVGMIPWPYTFTLAEDEVSRVFSIPLSWLAEESNFELRLRDLPLRHHPVPVIYFKTFEGEILWGVTAEITLSLLSALGLIKI